MTLTHASMRCVRYCDFFVGCLMSPDPGPKRGFYGCTLDNAQSVAVGCGGKTVQETVSTERQFRRELLQTVSLTLPGTWAKAQPPKAASSADVALAEEQKEQAKGMGMISCHKHVLWRSSDTLNSNPWTTVPCVSSPLSPSTQCSRAGLVMQCVRGYMLGNKHSVGQVRLSLNFFSALSSFSHIAWGRNQKNLPDFSFFHAQKIIFLIFHEQGNPFIYT